jgi:hypothetical protein
MGIVCKYVNIEITRSLVSKPVLAVMAHELPILKAKHGEGKIKPAKYQTDETREIDSVRDEFMRLQSRYGGPKGGDKSYVEEIFGNPQLDATYDTLEAQMKKEVSTQFREADGAPAEISKKIAPTTNNEGSAKITKANLNKGAMMAWLKEQGLEVDDEGVEIKAMTASDLTVWAKLKMHEMIEEMEKPVPADEVGTKTLSRMIITYQEEG